MRSKFSSNSFALACLLGTIWASVATSSGSSFYGTYWVSSDCVTPSFASAVTVSNNEITTSGVDYTTLGFPNNSLSLGATNSGYLGGKYRECENTLTEGDAIDDSFLYTCKDDGQYVCNVYFDSN